VFIKEETVFFADSMVRGSKMLLEKQNKKIFVKI
jgi:hypothetical protein